MVKLLPLGLVVVLMLGVLVYIRFNRQMPASVKQAVSNATSTSTGTSSLLPSNTSTDDTSRRLRDLEEAVALLTKKVTSITPAPSNSGANYTSSYSDTQIKSLQDTVVNLQKQIDDLKSSSTTTTGSKADIYIPLGSGGSSTAQDWSTLEGYQVSLDPADYPGYKSMQLEVNAKLAQSTGTGYVRLYNVTGGSAVSSSDASTGASTYTLATSGAFTLPAGSKTYQLQLKTSQGFELYIQSARIKVNF